MLMRGVGCVGVLMRVHGGADEGCVRVLMRVYGGADGSVGVLMRVCGVFACLFMSH